LKHANRIGRPGSAERRAAIAVASEQVYTFEQLLDTREGAAAVAKTEALLEKTHSTREDWAPNSPRYLRSQRRVCLSRLQELQTEIVKTVTERRVELEVLHRRVCGQAMARRFLGMINHRWKPLDKLVAAYNAEVERYNVHVDPDGDIRLRLLSHRELREVGVDQADGEIWDVERLLCNADWAVHDFVRRGIEARFRLQRVAEQRKLLLLHVHRILRWLTEQTAVLFRALDSDKTNSIKKLVQIELLHRDKVIRSFLKVAKKGGEVFWTADQQRELQQLHEGIVPALGVMLEQLEHDLDEPEGGDEGAEQLDDDAENEPDHGGFDEEVAERLIQQYERQVEVEGEGEEEQDGLWEDEEPAW
jgi:hypothetical protein